MKRFSYLALVTSITLKRAEALSRSFLPSFPLTFLIPLLSSVISVHYSLSRSKAGGPRLFQSLYSDTFISTPTLSCFFIPSPLLPASLFHLFFSPHSPFLSLCLLLLLFPLTLTSLFTSLFLSHFYHFLLLSSCLSLWAMLEHIHCYNILRAANMLWCCTSQSANEFSCNITYYTDCIIYYLSNFSLSCHLSLPQPFLLFN